MQYVKDTETMTPSPNKDDQSATHEEACENIQI